MGAITGLLNFFRKIPATLLVTITCGLSLILFSPEFLASKVVADGFRKEYRNFIGLAFLLAVSFLVARIYQFFHDLYGDEQRHKVRTSYLEKLTPEEKGYLQSYIADGENSLMCGPEDSVMEGLATKRVTYKAVNVGSVIDGFAFNLQSWVREHLRNNIYSLEGAIDRAMTPGEKLGFRRRF